MRVWLVALGRTAVQMSWLWGSIILESLGYHRAATVVVSIAIGWFARLLWEQFLVFRAWLQQRRGQS